MKRKGYPKHLKQFVTSGLENSEDSGDHKHARKENLLLVVWQDTEAISCCSTNAANTTAPVSRKRKDGSTIRVPCPTSIINYNANMGGVDRNDQLRGYYNTQIKSHKYYWYFFAAALDVAITIAFVLSKFFPELKTKSLKDFRVQLANELIGQYNLRKRRGRPSHYQPVQDFSACHFPTKAEKRRNRCHLCTTYFHKRRETVWECKECQLFFCHTGKEDDCFLIYHTQYGQI